MARRERHPRRGLRGPYLALLRFDLTLVPLAVTAMSAVGALARGAQRAYPGSLPGSVAAAALLMLVGWWCFVALRRARARGPSA